MSNGFIAKKIKRRLKDNPFGKYIKTSISFFATFLHSQNDYYFTANNRKTAFESKNNAGTYNAGGKKIYNTPKGETCFR